MKKIIFIMLLLGVAFQAHAERRLVLVDIYHITETDFTISDLGRNHDYDIAKPHCDAGGIPEIDEGAFHVFPMDTHWRVTLGEVIHFGNFWRLNYRGATGTVRFVAKVYCSYPIQCIKQ